MNLRETWIMGFALSLMATVGLPGCGDPAETATGSVVFVTMDDPSEVDVAETPDESAGIDTVPLTAVRFENIIQNTGTKTLDATGEDEATVPAVVSVPPSTQVDAEYDAAERGHELLNRNFFQHRLSIASSEDRVFLASDTGDKIQVGLYDEVLMPVGIFELEKTLEPGYSPNCEQSLKVLDLHSHIGIVELSCSDDVEVNIRYVSHEGEELGESVRFSISEPGRISISQNFASVVLASVTGTEVTWFELGQLGEINRVLSHELSPQDGERRLVAVAHHGPRLLLQYSDGLLRRASYSTRCGSTNEWNLRPNQTNVVSRRPFIWDSNSRRYLRYVGLANGEDYIEALPMNFVDSDGVLTTVSAARNPEIGSYSSASLVQSAAGLRLLFNEYSSRSFQVGNLDNSAEFEGQKRLHGELTKSWSILNGRASLFLFSGRCVDLLSAVHYDAE